jgi:hypothetical protein
MPNTDAPKKVPEDDDIVWARVIKQTQEYGARLLEEHRDEWDKKLTWWDRILRRSKAK